MTEPSVSLLKSLPDGVVITEQVPGSFAHWFASFFRTYLDENVQPFFKHAMATDLRLQAENVEMSTRCAALEKQLAEINRDDLVARNAALVDRVKELEAKLRERSK